MALSGKHQPSPHELFLRLLEEVSSTLELVQQRFVVHTTGDMEACQIIARIHLVAELLLRAR
jgi:hypothetical protein